VSLAPTAVMMTTATKTTVVMTTAMQLLLTETVAMEMAQEGLVSAVEVAMAQASQATAEVACSPLS